MRSRLVLASVLLVLAGSGGVVLRQLAKAGLFTRIEPHFAGSCRLVTGVVGPEDITIHPRSGIALVSASDRRADMAGHPVPGGIYEYDFGAAEPRLVNLTPGADVTFQPHGIGLWSGADGRDVLFVVNHPPKDSGLPGSTVEIFDYEGGLLVHRATLTDPSLVMLNDIVAVGIDRFYVTRTHRHPPGFRQKLETWLQRPGAQVLSYGPGGFRTAVDDLVFPNGINASADGRTVYVASVTGFALRTYDRDPVTERLTLRDVKALPGGPDNIEVAADGTLWIGAHPKLLRVEAHGQDAATLSPSQVLHVRADGRVDEVLLDDGAKLSGSSVAVASGNRLLVGQIFDDGILDCTMDATPGEGVANGEAAE